MNRIEIKFRDLKASNKKAFIAFITAGYPDLSVTEKLLREFSRVGVDIVELGVPFTDPMADGPMIQEASQEALKKKTRLTDIIKLVKKARAFTQMPIALMTYFNPVFCYGEGRFCRDAAAAGVDGVIIPDLPPEEGRQFLRLAAKAGLDAICFISPTTSMRRAKEIVKQARGFIYYVSLTGVTGARKRLAAGLKTNLARLRRLTRKPVCAGFGISTAAQAQEAVRFCDGVIVGSAIVRKIKENLKRRDLARRVAAFVSGLKRNV
jgi:tryptophan synthase alpha chain